MCIPFLGMAQERKWGIEANFSGGSFYENKTLLNEDQYNSYSVTQLTIILHRVLH